MLLTNGTCQPCPAAIVHTFKALARQVITTAIDSKICPVESIDGTGRKTRFFQTLIAWMASHVLLRKLDLAVEQ